MRRLTFLLLFVLAWAMPAAAMAQAAWVRHEDAAGRYSVDFPSPPSADLVQERGPQGQTTDVHLQEWESGDGTVYLAVSWQRLPAPPLDPAGRARAYETALRATIAANAGSELLAREPVSVDGVEGQDLVIDNPLSVNHIRQRQFITGGRLVQQTYVGPRGSTDDDPVEHFFESLRLGL